jgi:hypothetical protein
VTCRCATQAEHQARADANSAEYYGRLEKERAAEALARATETAKLAASRSTTDYIVERADQVGEHLVMLVKYPHCEHREFDGVKTMVFLNVSAISALRWKSIDPHFRGPNANHPVIEAPSPAARFPGNRDGWADAVEYAKRKT